MKELIEPGNIKSETKYYHECSACGCKFYYKMGDASTFADHRYLKCLECDHTDELGTVHYTPPTQPPDTDLQAMMPGPRKLSWLDKVLHFLAPRF